MTPHPNNFTYSCWNGLIKCLNIVHWETCPHTANFGYRFVWGVVVPSLCKAKHFHTHKSIDCAGHVVQFILFCCIFCNSGMVYRSVVILNDILIVCKISCIMIKEKLIHICLKYLKAIFFYSGIQKVWNGSFIGREIFGLWNPDTTLWWYR